MIYKRDFVDLTTRMYVCVYVCMHTNVQRLVWTNIWDDKDETVVCRACKDIHMIKNILLTYICVSGCNAILTNIRGECGGLISLQFCMSV